MTQNNVQLQNGNGPLAGFRNQLINGDFVVSQRIGFNAYATGLSSDFTADRWRFYCSGATGDVRVRTQNQVWATARAQGLQGALQVTNAAAAYSIRQGIELQTAGQPGPFVEGSTWTVSLYSLVEPSVNIAWSIGTAPGSGSFQNIVQQPSMVSLGNDRWSHTFTIGAGDAPLAGATCLMLSFNPAGDQTQANQFAGIQLEPGSVATPFEQRPHAVELNMCLRYRQKIRAGGKFGAGITRPGSGSKVLFQNIEPPHEVLNVASYTVSSPSVFTSAANDTTSAAGINAYQAGLSLQKAAKAGVEYLSSATPATIYGYQMTITWDCEL